MKEHGIIFQGWGVRAVQAGDKTHTRRIITLHNSNIDGHGRVMAYKGDGCTWEDFGFSGASVDAGPSPAGNPGPYLHVPLPKTGTAHRVYPEVQAGDRLWVREAFCLENDWEYGTPPERMPRDRPHRTVEHPDGNYNLIPHYRATEPHWEFMGDDGEPTQRWTPSIHMPRWASRITLDVLSVRPERIQDISLPSIMAEGTSPPDGKDAALGHQWREVFESLWDQINAKRGYGWKKNPWVWVYVFELRPPEQGEANHG